MLLHCTRISSCASGLGAAHLWQPLTYSLDIALGSAAPAHGYTADDVDDATGNDNSFNPDHGHGAAKGAGYSWCGCGTWASVVCALAFCPAQPIVHLTHEPKTPAWSSRRARNIAAFVMISSAYLYLFLPLIHASHRRTFCVCFGFYFVCTLFHCASHVIS